MRSNQRFYKSKDVDAIEARKHNLIATKKKCFAWSLSFPGIRKPSDIIQVAAYLWKITNNAIAIMIRPIETARKSKEARLKVGVSVFGSQ